MSPSAADWCISTVPHAEAAGCDFVRQWLREHNWSANGAFMERLHEPQHEARALVLLAMVDDGVVGGLFAETQLAWLRISVMAVKPEWRSQGIGGALLAEAERQALARGCKYAYADTMEYQAPRFYLARGFTVAGQIPDWDSHGHAKLYFSMRLSTEHSGAGI